MDILDTKKAKATSDLYVKLNSGTLTYSDVLKYAIDIENLSIEKAIKYADKRMPAYSQIMANKMGKMVVY